MKAETPIPTGICERWSEWHPEERKWLADFRDAMRTHYAEIVRRVILFGSRARGDFHEDSDIDVAIIANEAKDRKRRSDASA